MSESTPTGHSLRVADFDFYLPEELIAQHPPTERGASRMLVVHRDGHGSFDEQNGVSIGQIGTVTGHDFSRAEESNQNYGASAPAAGGGALKGHDLSRAAKAGKMEGAGRVGLQPNLSPEGSVFSFTDRHFTDLPSLLNPGDLLVLNASRVIPARLYARRANARGKQDPTGQIEVLLTNPDEAGNWEALVRPGRKVRPGDHLEFLPENSTSPPQGAGGSPLVNSIANRQESFATESFVKGHDFSRAENSNQTDGALALASPTNSETPALRAQVLSAGEFGQRTLRFDPTEDFFAILDQIGHIPLPPYIHRDDQNQDRDRYQTVFAEQRGSVAAPTAGLHFTPEILESIKRKGVEIAKITLHVGLGTFAPLRVENVSEIQLHRERYTLPAETAQALNRARKEHRRIVAVGTTVVRTLEHVAHVIQIAQGQPLEPHSGETQIFLSPGHQFQLVDAMLTNFHLPQSSLLMLVSAFAGRERVLAAYAHAVREKYRFFSYGDCMLLS